MIAEQFSDRRRVTPAEAAVDFYESAFAAFSRHFYLRAFSLSMSYLREVNPEAWETWSQGSGLWAEPESGLEESLEVIVSPDGREVWAATVGENRRAYIRLEMRGRWTGFFWWKSLITATAHAESEAVNSIVDTAKKLTACGWKRYLVEDGELTD